MRLFLVFGGVLWWIVLVLCGSRIQIVLATDRPQLVIDALAKNKPIYYFGLGSNMSRKKIENRGVNGTKIHIMTMEAAIVPNYRLAFSLRGFPPLEPAMGSLESIHEDDDGGGSHSPILAYHRPECHGALVKLTPKNYEALMRSEGIDPNNDHATTEQGRRRKQTGGYDEIVVEAFPYPRGQGGRAGFLHRRHPRSVQAIALRAKPQSRLSRDACPSSRYMTILREGAKELGLTPCYQQYLADHPIQGPLRKWEKREAFYNLIIIWTLSFRWKIRLPSQIQSKLLYAVYSRPGDHFIRRWLGQVLTTMILLPGAIIGFLLYHILVIIGNIPPSILRLKRLLGDDDDNNNEKGIKR